MYDTFLKRCCRAEANWIVLKTEGFSGMQFSANGYLNLWLTSESCPVAPAEVNEKNTVLEPCVAPLNPLSATDIICLSWLSFSVILHAAWDSLC